LKIRWTTAPLLVLLLGLVLTGIASAQSGIDSLFAAGRIPPFDRPINPELYLIRPGERLQVVFLNTSLPGLGLTVNSEGKLVDRNLGVFDLTSLSLEQARILLLPKLQSLYNADEIVISVASVYPVAIQVSGQVRRPGRYLAYTSQTVRDIIDSAGGLWGDASHRNIVLSGGIREIIADLDKSVYLGDERSDPNLYAGRHVFVPRQSDAIVQVIGEVLSPRAVELVDGDSLALLLALAGGAGPDADLAHIYLANDSARSPHGAGSIRSLDIVAVPRLGSALEETRVVVVGSVADPGYYPYQPGMTAADLLGQAGGVTEPGNLSRTAVFRLSNTGWMGGLSRLRFPLSSGEVAQLKEIVLAPGDSVFVPMIRGHVWVSGEVRRPGLYPYSVGTKVRAYVEMAGGFTEQADRNAVMVFDRVTGLTWASPRDGVAYDGDEIEVQKRATTP